MVTAAQRAAKEAQEKMEAAIDGELGGQPLVLGAKLRDPFPRSQVGILPKSNVKLEYVGHGAVTARLLDVDPEWTWEPVAYDADGAPLVERDQNGKPVGLWIKLTVNGVTRLGYGDCLANQMSAVKVLIGDALRNAAMRFGVALDLWVRGQGEDDEQFRGNTQERDQGPPPDPEPSAEEIAALERYRAVMARAGALKTLDEDKYVTPLRMAATAAGFQSVNDWGKADVESFEAAVAGQEEAAVQDGSGEPEEG